MVIKCRTMILKYQLVFFVINKLLVNGEWVEMPQFSDESKVYKLSVHNAHESFYNKFSNNDQKPVSDYDVTSINPFLNEFGTNTEKNTSREISTHETENSEVASINPSNIHEELLDSHASKGDDIFIENLDSKEILSIDVESSTPAISSTLELPTEEPGISSTAMSTLPEEKADGFSPKEQKYNNETVKNLGFQDYLPMEMLKKVHQTLKSQTSTLKGKIRFLKQFEKDLIAEIEARLGTALTPPRQTRGTHDYYDHDDELGFPSLEGALMAISFLTFAVYLVRLVMLLFRNANNTTTNATILFGRNRRSTDTINNKTQEIFNYLNTFDTN